MEKFLFWGTLAGASLGAATMEPGADWTNEEDESVNPRVVVTQATRPMLGGIIGAGAGWLVGRLVRRFQRSE